MNRFDGYILKEGCARLQKVYEKNKRPCKIGAEYYDCLRAGAHANKVTSPTVAKRIREQKPLNGKMCKYITREEYREAMQLQKNP